MLNGTFLNFANLISPPQDGFPWPAGEFWELESIHLEMVKVEKHCSSWFPPDVLELQFPEFSFRLLKGTLGLSVSVDTMGITSVQTANEMCYCPILGAAQNIPELIYLVHTANCYLSLLTRQLVNGAINVQRLEDSCTD